MNLARFTTSKSSDLWHYRRFILSLLPRSPPPESEFTAVASSLQNEPKNYYAWYHLSWLVKTGDIETRRKGWEDAVKSCKISPTDNSALSFLHLCGVHHRPTSVELGDILESYRSRATLFQGPGCWVGFRGVADLYFVLGYREEWGVIEGEFRFREGKGGVGEGERRAFQWISAKWGKHT